MNTVTRILSVELLILMFLSCTGKNNDTTFFKSNENISLIKIEVGKVNQADKILLISDKSKLERLNNYFKTMKKTSKFFGGSTIKSLKLHVYKGKNSITFWVFQSPYYGWILSFENYDLSYENPLLFKYLDSLTESLPSTH